MKSWSISAMPAIPKPPPDARERRAPRSRIAARDRAGHARVKQRSGGRCECVVVLEGRGGRRATAVPHRRGGGRRRGRGASALAKNTLHLCAQHHRDITAHRLGLIEGLVAASEDGAPVYVRLEACAHCGTTVSQDGDWYRLCGPCRWRDDLI